MKVNKMLHGACMAIKVIQFLSTDSTLEIEQTGPGRKDLDHVKRQVGVGVGS